MSSEVLNNPLDTIQSFDHVFYTLANENKYFDGTDISEVCWLSRVFRKLFSCCCDNIVAHCRKASLKALKHLIEQSDPKELNAEQIKKLCKLNNSLAGSKMNGIFAACHAHLDGCMASWTQFEQRAKEEGVVIEAQPAPEPIKKAVDLGEKKPPKKKKKPRFHKNNSVQDSEDPQEKLKKENQNAWTEHLKQFGGSRGVLLENNDNYAYASIKLNVDIPPLNDVTLYFDSGSGSAARIIDAKHRIARLLSEKNGLFYKPQEIVFLNGKTEIDEKSALTVLFTMKNEDISVALKKPETEPVKEPISVKEKEPELVKEKEPEPAKETVKQTIKLTLTPTQQQAQNISTWIAFENSMGAPVEIHEGMAQNSLVQGVLVKGLQLNDPAQDDPTYNTFLENDVELCSYMAFYYSKDAKPRICDLKRAVVKKALSKTESSFKIDPKEVIFTFGGKQQEDNADLGKIVDAIVSNDANSLFLTWKRSE